MTQLQFFSLPHQISYVTYFRNMDGAPIENGKHIGCTQDEQQQTLNGKDT